MAVRAIPKKPGKDNHARVVCDDCEKSVEVACAYKNRKPDEHAARTKAQQLLGWQYIKRKLYCDACVRDRKQRGMKDQPEPPGQTPREPTREQKREIDDLLRDVYDIDAGCYRQGDTDETVAAGLEVMPGWVAQIREDRFGPDGGNQEMSEIEEALQAMRVDLAAVTEKIATLQVGINECARIAQELRNQNDVHIETVARIKKAVGPRTLSLANVK